jgi:hypothetical protein
MKHSMMNEEIMLIDLYDLGKYATINFILNEGIIIENLLKNIYYEYNTYRITRANSTCTVSFYFRESGKSIMVYRKLKLTISEINGSKNEDET